MSDAFAAWWHRLAALEPVHHRELVALELDLFADLADAKRRHLELIEARAVAAGRLIEHGPQWVAVTADDVAEAAAEVEAAGMFDTCGYDGGR
jgi:hypothetical protein